MLTDRYSFWGRWLAAVSLSVALAGCGGGGGGGSDDGGGTPVTGSQTGVFTDAPVNGLTYVASPSGVTGVTGDNGTDGGFRYEPGDTVTFTLGGLTLGSTTGAATVTPADISGGNPTVAANLLVLLQSLDSDSAEGRIAISLPASTSLSGLSLTQSTTDFASAAAFTEAVAAAGGTVVDPQTAVEHATAQFWQQAAGVWFARVDSATAIVIRIDAQGRYLMGETGLGDEAGQPGIEYGRIDWDPTTQIATAVASIDTSGDWGLSSSPVRLRMQGTQLEVGDLQDGAVVETLAMRRLDSQANSIIGIWVVEGLENATDPLSTQTFVFGLNGGYMMIDPVGDVSDGPGDPLCGGAGLESGNYVVTGDILSITQMRVDTNGCAGLNEPTPGGDIRTELRNMVLSADGSTLDAEIFYPALGQGDGPVRLLRVTP